MEWNGMEWKGMEWNESGVSVAISVSISMRSAPVRGGATQFCALASAPAGAMAPRGSLFQGTAVDISKILVPQFTHRAIVPSQGFKSVENILKNRRLYAALMTLQENLGFTASMLKKALALMLKEKRKTEHDFLLQEHEQEWLTAMTTRLHESCMKIGRAKRQLNPPTWVRQLSVGSVAEEPEGDDAEGDEEEEDEKDDDEEDQEEEEEEEEEVQVPVKPVKLVKPKTKAKQAKAKAGAVASKPKNFLEKTSAKEAGERGEPTSAVLAATAPAPAAAGQPERKEKKNTSPSNAQEYFYGFCRDKCMAWRSTGPKAPKIYTDKFAAGAAEDELVAIFPDESRAVPTITCGEYDAIKKNEAAFARKKAPARELIDVHRDGAKHGEVYDAYPEAVVYVSLGKVSTDKWAYRVHEKKKGENAAQLTQWVIGEDPECAKAEHVKLKMDTIRNLYASGELLTKAQCIELRDKFLEEWNEHHAAETPMETDAAAPTVDAAAPTAETPLETDAAGPVASGAVGSGHGGTAPVAEVKEMDKNALAQGATEIPPSGPGDFAEGGGGAPSQRVVGMKSARNVSAILAAKRQRCAIAASSPASAGTTSAEAAATPAQPASAERGAQPAEVQPAGAGAPASRPKLVPIVGDDDDASSCASDFTGTLDTEMKALGLGGGDDDMFDATMTPPPIDMWDHEGMSSTAARGLRIAALVETRKWKTKSAICHGLKQCKLHPRFILWTSVR